MLSSAVMAETKAANVDTHQVAGTFLIPSHRHAQMPASEKSNLPFPHIQFPLHFEAM
jgi:hypothetical protein